MVRIIDGEIVQDDDPRLRARQRAPDTRVQPPHRPQFAATSGQSAGATAAGQPAAGFDWSAPPFRAIPNEFGSALPDVEIYGLRVPGLGLVAVAATGLFFGWRGLLVGLVAGYLYLTYGQSAAAAAGGRPPAAAAGGSGGGFMQQGFAGAFGDSGGSSQPGGSGGPGHARQQGAGGTSSPWAGKGRKLGSS